MPTSPVPAEILDKRVSVAGEMIPLIQQTEWIDPDDTNERSTGRKVLGVRRTDALRRIQALGCPVTDAHVAAADLYRDDYQIGHEGAEPGRGRSMEVGGRFGPGSGPSKNRLDAIKRYRDATAVVGEWERPVLQFILIDNGSLAGASAAFGVSYEKARQMLLAVVQGLAEFYEALPPRETTP